MSHAFPQLHLLDLPDLRENIGGAFCNIDNVSLDAEPHAHETKQSCTYECCFQPSDSSLRECRFESGEPCDNEQVENSISKKFEPLI